MIGFLVSFKRRHPRVWAIVESVNGALFCLRYGRVERVAASVLEDYHVAGCSFSVVEERDLTQLETFLAGMSEDSLKWFRPHDFDGATLRRLFLNPAFLMMAVKDPDGSLVGYFLLRCFFIGKSFAGLIVDPEWYGRDIGCSIWEASSVICSRLGLRMLATISEENIPSLESCRKGTDVTELERLGNGYILVECKAKNNIKKV